MISSARASTCSVPGSRSPRAASTRLRRCCSRPPAGSSRSTPRLLVRPIWTRSPRRCSPAAWPVAMVCRRSRRPLAARNRRRSPRARPTCCSMAWPCSSPTGYAAGTPICRRALQAFCREDTCRRGRTALALARVDHRGGSVGRRDVVRALHAPCGDGPRRRRAQRASARAHLTRLRRICSPASCRRPRRWSSRREPSRRRPAATSPHSVPSDSPPCRAAPARPVSRSRRA